MRAGRMKKAKTGSFLLRGYGVKKVSAPGVGRGERDISLVGVKIVARETYLQKRRERKVLLVVRAGERTQDEHRRGRLK